MKLRELPNISLDPRVVPYWRITNLIYSGIFFILVVGAGIVVSFFAFKRYALIISAIFAVLIVLYVVFQQLVVIPLRYSSVKYSLNISDIDRISGVFIKTRCVVPFKRVQSVSTETGPILRRFDLAHLEIYTASSIPFILQGLNTQTAEIARQRISALARSAQEDV